jgi:8-oxo-dGTP pyrophosphatase MutT (NUDIX family)
MNNFEFEHEGESYWYSRSMTVVTYLFTTKVKKDKNGYYSDRHWYVLADKRGIALPKNKHKWNCPGGYLDFNETLAQAACREIHEETGVSVSPEDLHPFAVKSEPIGKAQNMNISFWTYIPDQTFVDANPLTNEYADPDEVEEVQWIDIEKLSDYKFGYGQQNTILYLYRTYIRPSNLWKYLMYCLWNKLNRKYNFLSFK